MKDLARRSAAARAAPCALRRAALPAQSKRDIFWHARVVLPQPLSRGGTSRWDLHGSPVGCSCFPPMGVSPGLRGMLRAVLGGWPGESRWLSQPSISSADAMQGFPPLETGWSACGNGCKCGCAVILCLLPALYSETENTKG